ncbi:S1 RNA-binding domain-containing protein [Sciscionella sediminilitoris]|uniref:S1 RNA-binding domain-containing protein n=1 Tax=Sciscionella sediminilitoris TaxID=1445613 RepID=UPI0004DEE6C0|nr:S1 RNA-binding domain-containing protein [Sciscionella sp. SE31]
MSHSNDAEQAWREFLAANEVGSVLDATVASVVPFGAFLEIAPGVHGLLHAVESDTESVPGQRRRVRILAIDAEQQRCSLAPA